MEQSPKKFLLFLDLVGIITCTLLIFIDLRIKQDLLKAAIRLENKIAEANGQTGYFPHNELSSIRNPVPALHLDNHEDNEHANMEMEDVHWGAVEENSEPEKTVSRARGANGRFQARSG